MNQESAYGSEVLEEIFLAAVADALVDGDLNEVDSLGLYLSCLWSGSSSDGPRVDLNHRLVSNNGFSSQGRQMLAGQQGIRFQIFEQLAFDCARGKRWASGIEDDEGVRPEQLVLELAEAALSLDIREEV